MSGGLGEPDEDLPRADGERSAYQTLVEVATELLNADRCELLIEADDRLTVQASSDPRPTDANRSYPVWTGLPGRAYATGTAFVIDDQHDTRSAATAESSQSPAAGAYRSLCGVPIEGQGLLLAQARRPGAFTEAHQELAERLVEVGRSSLDRMAAELAPALDGGTRDARDHAELLEEIADILSHDLKNPLGVAQGNLELARETGEDQFFEKAANALQRIDDLVDGVVSLAQTGRLVEQLESVDLRERAQAAWENVQTADAELQLEGSLEFTASKRGLSHLLENLIDNALTHAGPAVTVRIGVVDDGFYLEDDGPGIPDEHRDRIFERGYPPDSASSGLGLHIVKRIADAHGWTLRPESSADGGARFEFTGVEVEH